MAEHIRARRPRGDTGPAQPRGVDSVRIECFALFWLAYMSANMSTPLKVRKTPVFTSILVCPAHDHNSLAGVHAALGNLVVNNTVSHATQHWWRRTLSTRVASAPLFLNLPSALVLLDQANMHARLEWNQL